MFSTLGWSATFSTPQWSLFEAIPSFCETIDILIDPSVGMWLIASEVKIVGVGHRAEPPTFPAWAVFPIVSATSHCSHYSVAAEMTIVSAQSISAPGLVNMLFAVSSTAFR